MRKGSQPAGESGILANALFGLAAQVTTAAFTTVLTLYLVRALGPDDYGLFSLALSVGAVLLMISDFGLASSVGRFVAERSADIPNLKRVTDNGLRLKLIGAVPVSVGLALLAPLIADLYGKPGLEGPLRFTAVTLFFESMLMLYTSAFGALRRVSLNAMAIFIESLMETTWTIALVAVGAGVSGAIAGRAIGYGFGVFVAVVLLHRIVGRARVARTSGDEALSKDIVSYAKPLLFINGAYTLYVYVDALLIGALLTSRDVGEFTAPLRLVTLVGYVGQSVATAIAPRLAGTDPDVPAFRNGLRLLIILQVLLVVPLVAWAQPLVVLFLGSDYRLAGDVLRALAPYALLYGLGPLITMTVTFLGGARQRIPIVVGALVVNLVIDLVLLPTIGVLGATIGTGVAFAIYVPAHLRICVKEFDLEVRPMLVTLARSLVAGECATATLLAIGQTDLNAWQYIAGAALAPAVYVGALLLVREVSVAELRLLAAFLRRR